MIKFLINNEENFLEIFYSNRVYVDPEAPTDIIIVEVSALFRVRIRFADTSEAESFMDLLFECDKINLKEIAEDNPGLSVTVEEDEAMEAMLDVIDEALDAYLQDYEYGTPNEEDEDET